MAAAYDDYDYPSYWKDRDYEHGAETIALKAFLDDIKKIGRVLEIGAGHGRITPIYLHRAKKVTLSEPSAKLLKIAKSELKDKRISFLQSSLENLPKKIKSKSVDLAIMIRVLHHIKDPEHAFSIISKLTKNKGYFILEFPNKQHLKATALEFLKGNLTFPLDIFPKDLRSMRSRRHCLLPFKNYHPDDIQNCLEKSGFRIIEKRSVSNIRSPFIKRRVSCQALLNLEKRLQKPLSKINFGPSIFILAQKS